MPKRGQPPGSTPACEPTSPNLMTSARFMSGSRQLLEDLPGLEAEGPGHRKGRVKGTGPAQLDHAAWDERRRELNVVYEANLNGESKRACEIMQFDTSGRQIGGEAIYGAIV